MFEKPMIYPHSGVLMHFVIQGQWWSLWTDMEWLPGCAVKEEKENCKRISLVCKLSW